MHDDFIPRDVAAEKLSVTTKVLLRYEAQGLVRPITRGDVAGYDPREVRRAWTVVSLHRDLGINLAGVEAILRLRSQIDRMHARMGEIADRLRSALDEGGGDEAR